MYVQCKLINKFLIGTIEIVERFSESLFKRQLRVKVDRRCRSCIISHNRFGRIKKNGHERKESDCFTFYLVLEN